MENENTVITINRNGQDISLELKERPDAPFRYQATLLIDGQVAKVPMEGTELEAITQRNEPFFESDSAKRVMQEYLVVLLHVQESEAGQMLEEFKKKSEEPIDVHKEPPRADSNGTFSVPSNPDIQFRVSGSKDEWETLVIHKGKPVFPTIPSKSEPMKASASRDDKLVKCLVGLCGLKKDEAKKAIMELPNAVAIYNAGQQVKYDKWMDARAKLEAKERAERMKEEKDSTTYMINIDYKVVGGESAVLVFEFDNEKKVYTTQLLIDDEPIAKVESVRPFWDGNENSEMENALYAIVMERYNATRETVFKMFTEFWKAGATYVDKIRALNPKEARKMDIQKAREFLKKENPEAGITDAGKLTYFDCIIPKPYKVNKDGNYKIELKRSPESGEYEPTDVPISQMPIMITGKFESEEGTDHVEITLVDGGKKRVLYSPIDAVLGRQEFRTTLRPKSVRIDDVELGDMLKFFNSCITANIDPNATTAFRQGECHHHTGFTSPMCEKFIAGHFMLSWNGKEVVQEECVYTDEISAHICDPVGTLEAYRTGVEPIMQFNRVRFIMYVAAAAMLLRWLSLTSFICDIYGGIKGAENDKSGSGKTTMGVCSMSLFGNANPKNGTSLFNVCASTENYIEATLNLYTDLPVFLDESTMLHKEEKEKLVYRISNRVSKGRAKKSGGAQRTFSKTNAVITSGEHPLIPEDANIGTQVRALGLQGGIGVTRIRTIVKAAENAANENSGHLLIPFLREFWINKTGLKDYYLEAERRFVKTTTNPMSQRQAGFFAVIETAGLLLENAFGACGFKQKSATEVVKAIWYETTHENPITSYWRETLDLTMQWINANEAAHFQLPETVHDIFDNRYEIGGNRELFGWRSTAKGDNGLMEDVINVIPLKLKEFLAAHNRDYQTTLQSWMEQGIVNWSIYKGRRVPTTVADKHGKSARIIQIREKRAMDTLHDDW